MEVCVCGMIFFFFFLLMASKMFVLHSKVFIIVALKYKSDFIRTLMDFAFKDINGFVCIAAGTIQYQFKKPHVGAV